MAASLSVKTARRNCLDCSGGSSKAVTWCPCDGLHSTLCEFWSFRLGAKPATIRTRYGDRLLTPAKMPSSVVELEKLPAGIEEASTAEIEVDGYHQPAVTLPAREKRVLTREERDAISKRLRKGREKQRGAA